VRSEKALKLALAERYVQGVSTRNVSAVLEQRCGPEINSPQVSQCAAKLDTELESWRNRPLGLCPYVILDARYAKVRQGSLVLDCVVLIALGINPDRKRTILGVSAALSEAEVHGRSFLTRLQKRGLHGGQLIVNDDHAGLGAAPAAVVPSGPWQRCQFHRQQNAQAFVPRLAQRAAVAAAVRSVCNCPAQPSAERRLKEIVADYAPASPKLAAWLEENLPQGFTVFSLPAAHQRRLRTPNALERVNMKLKRRTRVASLFPNETSLLQLVPALLADYSDEGETGNIYLNLECRTQPSV